MQAVPFVQQNAGALIAAAALLFNGLLTFSASRFGAGKKEQLLSSLNLTVEKNEEASEKWRVTHEAESKQRDAAIAELKEIASAVERHLGLLSQEVRDNRVAKAAHNEEIHVDVIKEVTTTRKRRG